MTENTGFKKRPMPPPGVEVDRGTEVPDCIIEDLRNFSNETPLRKKAENFQFPLSKDDIRDLAYLGLRFENLRNIAGLSLPQIGVSKRAIIFELRAPKDKEWVETGEIDAKKEPTANDIEIENPLVGVDLEKELQKKDPDVLWPKTLWINPSYTVPRDALLDEDYEICYSLKCEDDLVMGPVFRLNRINYRAYDSQGRIYEGVAEGAVARVIQHEIDHLDGKLYIDYTQPERVMPLPMYSEKMDNGEVPGLQKGLVPTFPNE